MTNETRSKPQPKLVWPFLAWNFGWTWGFMLLAIILKNLWPENPPVLYLALEGLLTSLSMFGPVIASLIVLKIKGFKAICSFIFSSKKGTWLYLLLFCGSLAVTFALASGGKLVDGALLSFIGSFIYLMTLAGGMEEPGWRGFLQPALEKKFSMLIASSITGLAWACWHIPLWFYDRFYDRSQNPFLVYTIVTIVQSIWFAALHKKTKSVLACMIFHALLDILIETFVGINLADKFDFSQVNSLIYLGGMGIMTLYSIYLWYRADKEEKNA